MIKQIVKVVSISVVIGVVLLLLLQLIPYGKDHNNPPVVSEPNWDNQQTRELAKRACFDCHSNETIWLWYSNIAPASWLIYYDAMEARNKFNFSNWQSASVEEPEEFAEVINEGEMPPLRYLLMHTSARLSQAGKQQLINGLIATLRR